MGKEIYDVLNAALNNKMRTAKTYAATLKRIHRQIFTKEIEGDNLAFVKQLKTQNFQGLCPRTPAKTPSAALYTA